MTFMEASAKDNHNIEHIFTRLADIIIQQKEKNKSPNANRTDSVQLNKQQSSEDSSRRGCKC